MTPTQTSSTPETTSVSAPLASKSTLPPPPTPNADGVRLVNSLNGTTEGSGFAYFNKAVDGNNGAQPNDFAVAKVGVYAQWENQNQTGYFEDTNTSFWVLINSTNAAVNAAVGEASNGYRNFTAYQDDGRLLYKQDLAEFYGIYYCQ
ncbi:hypothetical protein ACLMJK_006491 [Lecanora helva]